MVTSDPYQILYKLRGQAQLKLLFVCTDRGYGGIGAHLVSMSNTMLKSGHNVAVLIRRGSVVDKKLSDSKVTIFYGIFKGAADPRGLWALGRSIKKFSPDWLVGTLSKEYWPVLLAGRLSRTRVALFRHVPTPMRRGSQYLLPRWADRFIVVSEYMRKYFIDQGIPGHLIHVVGNPLDENYFTASSELRNDGRKKFHFNDNDIVVGFAGAINEGKGVLVLAEAINSAMRNNAHIKMLWIGFSPLRPILPEHLLAGCPDPGRHTMVDWANDVRPYYAMMDMLAMPSIGVEAFGRVCVEAQACGVPVLGSKRDGIPEALSDGLTGRLLPPGDVRAWKNAILDLAEDVPSRYKMGQAGLIFAAEHFSPDIIAKKFESVLGT